MTYTTDVEVTDPVDPYPAHVREVRTYRPTPLATVERIVAFIFGLIELVILLRIVLVLLAARQGNDIVQFVYGISDVFVAPFRGMFGINEIQAGAAALDIAAVVALIGWVIIELIVLAVVRLFRPTATA